MASPSIDRRLGLLGDKSIKAPVTVSSTGPLTLSGEQTIDSYAVLETNAAGYADRVLARHQPDPTQNGVYDVSTGNWTRSLDANGNTDMANGTLFYVTRGGQAGQFFQVSSPNPVLPGQTAVTFAPAVFGTRTVTDRIVGDGTTTVFTLSTNPGDVNNVAFTLGGAGQTPGVAYTLTAANQVTCAAAPPLGVAGFFKTTVVLPVGSTDAAQVTYTPAGGPVVTRTARDKLGDIVNARDFGAKFDGVTDDTAAMNAAVAAVFNAGGGTLQCPPGTCMVSSIAFTWAGIGTTVNIKGSGTLATYFQKIGTTTTTPIFSLSTSGIIGVYLSLEDFTVLGNNTGNHDGILANRIAYIKTRNLRITQCANSWNSTGNLVTSHYNPEFFANKVGAIFRKSSDGVYSNLVQFFGGVIKSNSAFGLDLGECNQISFYGTDFELNGTSGNTSTGTFRIRSTVVNEFGWANISLKACWFELNVGDNFVAESAAGLDISLDDCLVNFSEGAKGMNIGAIRSLVLKNTYCDGVISAAASTTIIGGNITTPTITSTYQKFIGAQVGGVTYVDYSTGMVLAQGSAAILSGTYSSGRRIVYFQDTGLSGANSLALYHVNGASGNVAACAASFAASSSTSRSINAGGTVNASGADYAEYEMKAATCGDIPKGAVVGFNSSGLLTDKFSESVSFGIKSTNPSYVGGDTWFDEEKNHDMDSPEWAEQQARHEAARARVDRIAYAGKVPVVTTVVPGLGDYLVPSAGAGDTIVPLFVPEAEITFTQYRRAIGQVRSIQNGVATVTVKVL